MNCPKCGAEYKAVRVIDTRPSSEFGVRRRRACTACGYRFTTYEITQKMKAKYDRAIMEKEGKARG
jgi:transcriptional repressor NrdR